MDDQDWLKKTEMRQPIMRAANLLQRAVEVGVLADDRNRAGFQIIRPKFNRWTPGNDFKYSDEHFGINQISSYAPAAKQWLRGQINAIPGFLCRFPLFPVSTMGRATMETKLTTFQGARIHAPPSQANLP